MALPRFSRFLIPLAFLAGLSGCSWLGMDDVDWDPGDWFSSGPEQQANPVDEKKLAELNRFPFEQMAPEAPPPPQAEWQPPHPEPGDEYAWRPGHWDYVDLQGFVWRGGYWIKKPAFTAVWKPDFWMHHTYGWALVPGHWE